MKLGSVYKGYLKNNMFMKLLLVFALIAVLAIIVVSYVIYISISQANIRRELDIQKSAMESVDRYIHQRYDEVQGIVRDMYWSESLSSNLSFFLNHPYSEYVQQRMDQFFSDSGGYPTDVLRYFQNVIDTNSDMRNLMLYSANRQILSSLNMYKQFKQQSVNAIHSYIPDVMALDSKYIAAPNIWLRKAVGQEDPALYSIRAPINNKQTLKNDGQLVIFLDSRNIANALTGYISTLKGEIAVLSADGTVIFDSKNRYYGKTYPYFDGTKILNDNSPGFSLLGVSPAMYINKLASADGGYVIIGAAPHAEIAQSYQGIRSTIITISIICILIAVLVPALFVMNIAKRTNRIIRFTHKVRGGDFAARIEDRREDELGQISRSFNAMLDELEQYIERVYKAEIKQKETEMIALQARISPHFLYNTLEVIRMRAISQGARDVGEMIYSLSVLFKSLVQQKKHYTLRDELEMCRLYLELFRIRYKDKFNYTIDADPALLNRSIMRLSLQPVVENYIVHGIRTNSTDNELTLQVREQGHRLCVEVSDNGGGIAPERLAEIRMELAKQEESGQMFGLRSVHTRLRLLHGSDYGVALQSKEGEGAVITVCYPNQEERGD
ncbi:histidine kinase [Paenibacillus sp. JX-17]|uniref:histidine kinase n=1 Tax=Paenibacillus lacisoli TaxID=3064525 RepID=A0ABT9CHR0_9BACL|nr:histidine kinase [Paenibacillus sp. JX-17]MDO7908169.1 histidine kinase [Paenibacillus sp. JX-17]